MSVARVGSRRLGPTLVDAVGTQFIDRFAASLKDLAVAPFGTNDKTALVIGIWVVSLIVGAVIGRAAQRRLWVGIVGFIAFGLVGLYSLAKDPQGELSTAIVASVCAVVAGIATLVALLRLARRRSGDAAGHLHIGWIDPPHVRRHCRGAGRRRRRCRRARPAHRDHRRGGCGGDRPAAAATATTVPTSTGTPSIAGLSPYITPTADFYRIDTALSTPQVDVGSWQLEIKGMVDRPYTLVYDELLALESVEDIVTLQRVQRGRRKPRRQRSGRACRWRPCSSGQACKRAPRRSSGDPSTGSRPASRRSDWTAALPSSSTR